MAKTKVFVKGDMFAWCDELRQATKRCELTAGTLKGGTKTIFIFSDTCKVIQAKAILRALHANSDFLDLEDYAG